MGHDALNGDEKAILGKAEKLYDLLGDISMDLTEAFAIQNVVNTLLNLRAALEQANMGSKVLDE